MNGLSIVILVLVVLCSSTWYIIRDEVSCIISNSENNDVNGYFVAYNGVYYKRNFGFNSIPEVFLLLKDHYLSRLLPTADGTVTIMFSKSSWTINSIGNNRKVLYTSNPDHPENYLFRPPEGSWSLNGKEGPVASALMVHSCKGDLVDSPQKRFKRPQTNIEQILAMPATSGILVLIFYVAYYLYGNRVDVSAVAYSYEAIVARGEYHKIVTATLSHYELLHLGFNSMAFYSIGSQLEPYQYSTIEFLYSNVNLIFLTILIETVILYVLIHRYNQSGLAANLSIGYSGVIFAWMVAASVRMNEYCPIMIFPSFCVKTFHIPLPNLFSQNPADLTSSLPINLGPFVLLFFIKLVIPRSSFLGHLSGILIGYPLAWYLLSWMTPPVTAALLAGAYMWKERLFLFDRNSSANHDELFSNLADFVNPTVLLYYKVFSLVGFLVIGGSILSVLINANGYGHAAVRCVVAFLVVYAQLARKHSFTSSNTTYETSCAKIMFCALVVLLIVFVWDTASLTAAFTSRSLFLGSGVAHHVVNTVLTLNCVLCVVEVTYIVFLLLNMYELPSALSYTSYLRMDKVSIEKDLERIGVMRLLRGAPQPFSGNSNRLGGAGSVGSGGSGSGGSSGGISMTPMPINTAGGSSSSAASARSNPQYSSLRGGTMV